ncbi:acyl-CoA dehydrogenase family protein [Gordonia caeni]|uniref:Acyl-CoA dehydrogenase family protein n=1 Tax=Gordonia caeni TaxID=1007097 RepID=A0ABP7PPZ4_9ACTN
MTVLDTTGVRSAAEAVDDADRDPFVTRVAAYARTVLAPSALETDRTGVTPERIAELADLGLLNHLAPAEYGGAGAGRAADRRIHEILSGACFNTWLVWAQHAPLAGRLAETAATTVPSALSAEVLHGRRLLGAGVSDIRRYPHDYISAQRHPGGWRLNGTVSWVSGWGLNTALAIGAVDTAREHVVTALVEVSEKTIAHPLDLTALEGSRTERVVLQDVFVPDDQVISDVPFDQWRRTDIGTAGDARSHHFGLADTVLRELDDDPHPPAHAVARTWRPRIAEIRARAYALTDEATAAGDGTHRIDERLALKVASGEALNTITRALLVARSGRGLGRDDTAQLYVRNALFVLVQGQRPDVREAQLRALADSPLPR